MDSLFIGETRRHGSLSTHEKRRTAKPTKPTNRQMRCRFGASWVPYGLLGPIHPRGSTGCRVGGVRRRVAMRVTVCRRVSV